MKGPVVEFLRGNWKVIKASRTTLKMKTKRSQMFMRMRINNVALASLIAGASVVTAFQAPSTVARSSVAFNPQTRRTLSKSSSLAATIDRNSVATNEELEDVCGINFTPEELEKRLERTSYLYPKHVEVVEDLSPLVDTMVDKIVS